MHFNRLRLSGFKSFVDSTEFHIEPGLTGIVGPNGCGKSNVAEALGWVMGETSPKRMRGTEMDDVIFAGTENRPPRNLAEVALRLDNAERRAPAQFNDSDEIEVVRRIERGSGSSYRVNGRDVLAREVQRLFADAVTGAHSTALVNQGQVDALINARPTDRRALLEEAAGITGLHSRRHEAELRLNAAELNLSRLDDVMAALESQLKGLKRQVRQAARYRNISSHIRRAEAILLHLRWTAASAEREAAARRLEVAEAQVAELTREAATASTAQAEVAERLPGLREAEAREAAALHRLMAAREGLEAEEQRLRDDQRRLEAHLAQIDHDTAREEGLKADAAEAMQRLESERAELEAARRDEDAERERAAARLEEARHALAEREAELHAVTERVAALVARRSSLSQSLDDLSERAQRLRARGEEIAAERAGLGPAETAEETDAAGETALETARREHAEAREAAAAAEQERLRAKAAEDEARERLQEVEAEAARLRAEMAALGALLAVNEDDLWPPLIDAVTVEQGYETALGAALGDDLAVSADEAAPVHWKSLEPYDAPPPLPADVPSLGRFVDAPPALARRLAQIGVVAADQGARLAPELAQGQRLVSREGALWRWDGYTVSAGAPTAAATRLSQRNRLAELRRALDDAEARIAEAREHHRHERAASDEAVQRERAARATLWQLDETVSAARDAEAEARRQAAVAQSRRAALATAAEAVAGDLAEIERRREEAQAALSELPAEAEARDELAALRGRVGELSAALADARNAHDRGAAEARMRESRLRALSAEFESWRRRAEAAAAQLEQHAARRTETAAALAALADRPAEIAGRRAALFEQISAAEASRARAADAVAAAESELAARDKQAKAANDALAAHREERVRLEAACQQADERLAALAGRIREALDCEPDEALAVAEVKDPDELPQLEWVGARLERLKRERDNMGPVNLLAEREAADLGEQLETMQTERRDLEAAIARLRQGIHSLNREGRERLLAAFGQVDEHFRDLFVRLFGGGRAELALTAADDPLDAGLEIMASPAGKRLQVISLLSGGEQALTALALLFAMFLTNPAPICVLDEVDAPLDDSNVARYCDLMDDIVRSTGTRFLIITHNPITMSRLDRLYGVTMSERGVSQLVSVDLALAEGLRAAS